MFLDTMPETIQQIETAFQEQNWELVGKSAHYAKSSFSVISVEELRTLVTKIESNAKKINTLGALKKAGYHSKSIKQEIRENLILKIKAKENPFPGILGYEDSVIPDTERALLSKHNILFLGLRGQAKTRMARQMTELLDEYIPIVAGSEINDVRTTEFRPCFVSVTTYPSEG